MLCQCLWLCLCLFNLLWPFSIQCFCFLLVAGHPCALIAPSSSLSFCYLYNLLSSPSESKSVVLISKGRICREEIRIFLTCVSLTDTTSQLLRRRYSDQLHLKLVLCLNNMISDQHFQLTDLEGNLEKLEALFIVLEPTEQSSKFVDVIRSKGPCSPCYLLKSVHMVDEATGLVLQWDTADFLGNVRSVWCNEQFTVENE